MFQAKMATCCYCGKRTVLVPTAAGGHELACGSCGAPLHLMKPLRPQQAAAATSHAPRKNPAKMDRKSDRKQKKKRKKKSLWQRAVSEVWDEIEDIFD